MKCKNCGTEMLVDTSVVYTSDPPMYKWKCPKCGCEEYHLTSEHEINTNAQQGDLVVIDEWFNFRCQAAKDLLGSIVANPSCNPNVPDKNLVTAAINLTDELIKQLKGEE